MSTTMSTSFTAVGSGNALAVKVGDKFSYAVSGTFSGTVVLYQSVTNGASWEQVSGVSAITGSASGTVEVQSNKASSVLFRFTCTAYTSGTIVTSIADAAQTFNPIVYSNDGEELFKITEDGVYAKAFFTNSGGSQFLADGSVSAPSLAFSGSSSNTGVYLVEADSMGFVANGVLIGRFSATGGWVFGPAASSGIAAVEIGNSGQIATHQRGVVVDYTGTTAATAGVIAFNSRPKTAAALSTNIRAGFFHTNEAKGAGSTISHDVGYYAEQSTQGTHNAILADNQAFSGSFGINLSTANAHSILAPLCHQRLNVASAATIASLSSAQGFVKLTGSTATDLQGIAAGKDGQVLRVWNATGQNLTIRNASASAASGEKITTCTGADVVTTANGFAEFIYDTDASPAVWVCAYVSA